MTNQINAAKALKGIVSLGLIVAAAVLVVSPSVSFAATYAYVNASGNVNTVVADNPNTAIATAPNISTHSGVMLLNSQSNQDMVGDSVSGV